MKLNLSENLKRLRKKHEITQEELAGFIGVSFQAVSKWERDEGYPDITLLPVIASFYNVTLDELMGMNEIQNQLSAGGLGVLGFPSFQQALTFRLENLYNSTDHFYTGGDIYGLSFKRVGTFPSIYGKSHSGRRPLYRRDCRQRSRHFISL